ALVADVMAHARGAGREDGEVGAAVALQLELVRLDRLANLVVRHFQRGARGHRGLVLGIGRGGLFLAEAVQVLRFGGVVAVAIDNHGALRCGFGFGRMLRGCARLSNRGDNLVGWKLSNWETKEWLNYRGSTALFARSKRASMR